MRGYFSYLQETDAEFYAYAAESDELTAHDCGDERGMMVYYRDREMCNYGRGTSAEDAIDMFRNEFSTQKDETK